MRALAMILVFAAFALAACGGDGGGSDEEAPRSAVGVVDSSVKADRTVEVSLTEWAVKPSKTSVKAGNVGFVVRNDGKQTHELLVVNTTTQSGSIPVVDERAVVQAAGPLTGAVENIGPGQEKTVTLQIGSSAYILLCNVPGHYEQGMHTGLSGRG
jgi:uncharacterized cupredoxin-like copper-binding protein